METQHSYISNFKSYLQFLFAILLLFSGLAFLANHLFEQEVIFATEISGASKINRMLYKTAPNEVPILGSSRAQGCYVPSLLGEEYVNYGIDGTQAKVWLFLFEKELLKAKSSPILINFELGGFTIDLGDLGNYIPDYSATKSLIEQESRYYYSIPFVKYFGFYENYLRYYFIERMKGGKHTDKGGVFETQQVDRDDFRKMVAKRRETEDWFKVADESLQAKFESLINSTTRPIYICIAPYHSSYFSAFRNLDEALKYLGEVEKLPHVEVFNFSYEDYPDSLFMDTAHLNYEGAKKFSNSLKQAILSRR